MKAKYKYKDINQVMRGIRAQIIDSVQFCYDYIPTMGDPAELFNYLKKYITFKHDPPNTELLQSAQTLFLNNKHGIAGAGDCDCFVILACAAFIAQGWGDFDIILAGRSYKNPVHIYCRIKFKNQSYIFDLTEPKFNQERSYKYRQILPVKFYS